MAITLLNVNGTGNIALINNTNSGNIIFANGSIPTPPPISGSVYTLIDTIIPYLRANSGSLRNPNFFTYFLDGNAYQISDGGNDMFDGGNYTAPWLLNNTNYTNGNGITIPPALNYASQSATLTDTNFYYASLGYSQSTGSFPSGNQNGSFHPLTLIGARSGSGPIGFQKAGNIGADGGGLLVTGSIYAGSVVEGFTAHAFYRQSYGQSSDPSICDVYILLGHPNWGSTFDTVISSSAAGTAIQGATLYATGSSSEILAMTTLLSRPSPEAISFNDIKTVVDNYIGLVRTVLGYPNIIPTPTPTPTLTPTPTPTPGGIITDSLFMKLDASNYTSGLWNDESGNGNNATINGATWLSDDGGIFDLDGLNDNIQISHVSNLSLNTTTQRTIQVWVKFDNLPALNTQGQPVFGKLSSSSGFDGYWGGLYSNTGNTRVVTNGTGIQRITDSTTNPVSINTWYLYTFISQITGTSNTTKVYINTTEVSSTAHGNDGYGETNPLYLGYIGSGVSSPYLNGKIGACYFYTKGLSAAEITTNFNATKAKYGL